MLRKTVYLNARNVLKHNVTFKHKRGGEVEGKEREKKNPCLNPQGLTPPDGGCNVYNGKRSVKWRCQRTGPGEGLSGGLGTVLEMQRLLQPGGVKSVSRQLRG